MIQNRVRGPAREKEKQHIDSIKQSRLPADRVHESLLGEAADRVGPHFVHDVVGIDAGEHGGDEDSLGRTGAEWSCRGFVRAERTERRHSSRLGPTLYIHSQYG